MKRRAAVKYFFRRFEKNLFFVYYDSRFLPFLVQNAQNSRLFCEKGLLSGGIWYMIEMKKSL